MGGVSSVWVRRIEVPLKRVAVQNRLASSQPRHTCDQDVAGPELLRHATYTVVCDHENVPIALQQFRQLHQALETMGFRPARPHFVARATWDWKNRKTKKLGQVLGGLGYVIVTCPPGPDAADQALERIMKLDTWRRPRSVIYLGADRFFGRIADHLRSCGSEIITAAKDRLDVSHKVVCASDRIVTLEDLGITQTCARRSATTSLPQGFASVGAALIEVIYRVSRSLDDGTSAWVALDNVKWVAAELPADKRPNAAGCRSVLRLAHRLTALGLLSIRRNPNNRNGWQLRCVTADWSRRLLHESEVDAA